MDASAAGPAGAAAGAAGLFGDRGALPAPRGRASQRHAPRAVDEDAGPLLHVWRLLQQRRSCSSVLGVLKGGASGGFRDRLPVAHNEVCKPAGGWDSYWAPSLFLDPSALRPRPVLLDTDDSCRGAAVPTPPGGELQGCEQDPGSDDGEAESAAEASSGPPKAGRRYGHGVQLHAAVPPAGKGSWPESWQDLAVQVVDGCRSSQPMAQVGSGLACGSLLLSLRLVAASWGGAAHVAPPLVGVLSALVALSGSTGCLLALGRPGAGDWVEMPPGALVGLACLCSALAPLPLVQLPRVLLDAAGGPVRLVLPGAVGAAVLFELAHRRWAHVDPARVAALRGREGEDHETAPPALAAPGGEGLFRSACRHWWRHFAPTASGDRGVGAVFLVSHLAVTYFAVHVDLALTQWRNGFLSVLQARDVVGFHTQLWDFLPIAVGSTLSSVYGGYLMTMWDLRWREELTRDFVDMWVQQKLYYRVRFAGSTLAGSLDNFDQRIVEDTAIFASSSRGLLCGAAEAAMRLAVFGPALIRLSPTPLVWQLCLVLSLLSSVLTHAIGRPLAGRNAALQRAEADLRTSLMRLRMFAEDIALQQGEAAEVSGTIGFFENMKAAAWLAARGTLQLSSFTSSYGVVGSIIPLLLLMPSYFQGHVTLGLMFQIEALVQGVRQSLDFFVGSYSEIAVWHAAGGRLLALEECAAALPAGESPPQGGATAQEEPGAEAAPGTLAARGLALAAPGGGWLLEGASFEWPAGGRVVLCGPPGSGKSALLRLLAGAWPAPTEGYLAPGAPGTALLVSSPGFRLPQRATLRQCLAYPEAIAAFDEELQEALALCGLGELVQKLDLEAEWGGRLSAPERQRLVFARLISRWPAGVRWLLLDDADSTLDGASALELQDRLAARLPAGAGVVVVSRHLEVSRRPGWRRVRLDPGRRALFEEAPQEAEELLACTGEAPPDLGSQGDAALDAGVPAAALMGQAA